MIERRHIVVLVAAAVAATVALHAAGSGSLAAPPLASWADLDAWYLERGAATATVALARLVGIGLGAWLALAGALQLMASAVGRPWFSGVVDALSPKILRAVGTGAAGLSVTAGLAVPVHPMGPIENPPGTAVMVPLDGPTTSTSTSTSTTGATTTSTSTTATPPPPATTLPVNPPSPAVPAPAPVVPDRSDEVVVAAGDSFWSIAVDEAGERDLVGYWRSLVDLNRDRLIDPSNPDLLYRGQVLRLP